MVQSSRSWAKKPNRTWSRLKLNKWTADAQVCLLLWLQLSLPTAQATPVLPLPSQVAQLQSLLSWTTRIFRHQLVRQPLRPPTQPHWHTAPETATHARPWMNRQSEELKNQETSASAVTSALTSQSASPRLPTSRKSPPAWTTRVSHAQPPTQLVSQALSQAVDQNALPSPPSPLCDEYYYLEIRMPKIYNFY